MLEHHSCCRSKRFRKRKEFCVDQSLINWASVADMIRAVGPMGVVLVLWFVSDRDTKKILARYKQDMTDQRRMYENNVELVRQAVDIAKNQQDVIIMNTRMMQGLVDRIESNQFCPMVRLKKIEGVQG